MYREINLKRNLWFQEQIAYNFPKSKVLDIGANIIEYKNYYTNIRAKTRNFCKIKI